MSTIYNPGVCPYNTPVVHAKFQRVRVLVNPRSGLGWSFDSVRRVFDRHWDKPGTDLSYQFCRDASDGITKARRAAEDRVDALLVVGGDGTVSTVGTALMGTEVALGVVPVGSGNGFARHFAIPLSPEKAIRTLAQGSVSAIDVGVVGDRPFLVTCGMAWDADITRSIEKSPVRGIIPYLLAGAYHFFECRAQSLTVELDSGEVMTFPDPMVFTIANLTQYGGGARIAPHAKPDDGCLELIAASRRNAPQLAANIARLFNGTVAKIPELVFRRFRSLTVKRHHPAPIQVDGELVEAPATVEVRVVPKALKVLVPACSAKR